MSRRFAATRMLTTFAIAASSALVLLLPMLNHPYPAHSQSSCAGVTLPAGFDCDVLVESAGIDGIGMVFDSMGNLYYTTGSNKTVKVVDTNGQPVATIDRSSITNAFPFDVIFDGSGNLFHSDINATVSSTSDSNDGAVFRDPAGANIVLVEGFPDQVHIPAGDPGGLAFPSGGNLAAGFLPGLYVANPSPGATLLGPGGGGSSGIFRISDPAGTPSASVFLNTSAVASHPIVDAVGLAFGPGGVFGNDLYVADTNICESSAVPCDSASSPAINDGAIYRVSPSGNVTLFAGGSGAGLEDPRDLVFSVGGPFGTFLYVADPATGKIVRISFSGAISDFGTGLTLPTALVFGSDGCLYAGERGSGATPNRIIRICAQIVGVQVDIKPSSFPNAIPDTDPLNLSSNGVTPVAIFTTPDFDAATTAPSTVAFAEAPAIRSALEDVDGDGDLDMVLHFETEDLNLNCSSTEANLTGQTTGGTPLLGTDSVRVLKDKNGVKCP